MSRLVIEVSPEQHKKIKALAALSGRSMKDYVLERLLDPSPEDSAYAELKSELHSRIKEAQVNEPSGKTITEIATEELEKPHK